MKTYWFTLLDPDSDSYCDSDCKPNDYIVHSILTYFHCQIRIPNAVAIEYYVELVSTDLDSDLDPSPIVFVHRLGTVNSKSFVGKDFLRIKWKYELTMHFKHEMIRK